MVTTTTMHPLEDAFAFAVAPDLASAYVVTGEDGTTVEVITLADGTRRRSLSYPTASAAACWASTTSPGASP